MFRFFKKLIKKPIFYFIKRIIYLIELYEYRNLKLDQDDINKKIISTLDIESLGIKVLTDTGYQPLSHLHITQPYRVWRVLTESGKYLECADRHILFRLDMSEVFTCELKVGDYIQTIDGPEQIVHITKSGVSLSMGDVTVNDENHRFYTNGILSHNTILTSIFIVHYCIFNNKKNIMMVANKGKTVVEVMNKIKDIYRSLPYFLKPGVLSWKEKGIQFDNECRILTENRVKEPSVGFSIDFLYADEFALIPETYLNTYWENIWPVVSSINNSRAIITSTPKGFNLFYELVKRASLPESDPEKNEFHLSVAYWWQIGDRMDLKVRLDAPILKKYNLTEEDVFAKLEEHGFKRIKTKLFDNESWIDKDKFYHFEKDSYTLDEARMIELCQMDGYSVKLYQVAFKVTNWKNEQINIFGESAFARQFDLKFSVGSDLLFKNEVLERLNSNKQIFEHMPLPELDKTLPFRYNELKWVKNPEILNMSKLKNYHYVLGVDVGEGLGRDYTVINIFKMLPMTKNEVANNKDAAGYHDNIRLEQVGIWRNNTASHEETAYMLYNIVFNLLDPDKVKVVLEINGGGGRVLDHLPKLYDGNNEFANYVMAKFKHSASAANKSIGIKLHRENKPIIARTTKTLVESNKITLYDPDTIKECSMFIISETAAGNLTFAAQTGNDDIIMSTFGVSAFVDSPAWNTFCEGFFETLTDEEKATISEKDFISSKSSIDYGSTLNAVKDSRANKLFNVGSKNPLDTFKDYN